MQRRRQRRVVGNRRLRRIVCTLLLLEHRTTATQLSIDGLPLRVRDVVEVERIRQLADVHAQRRVLLEIRFLLAPALQPKRLLERVHGHEAQLVHGFVRGAHQQHGERFVQPLPRISHRFWRGHAHPILLCFGSLPTVRRPRRCTCAQRRSSPHEVHAHAPRTTSHVDGCTSKRIMRIPSARNAGSTSTPGDQGSLRAPSLSLSFRRWKSDPSDLDGLVQPQERIAVNQRRMQNTSRMSGPMETGPGSTASAAISGCWTGNRSPHRPTPCPWAKTEGSVLAWI
mmetsp:Transcript_10717/g.66052  ORF Transcript_10717/g.66052 Transcript_10717/m.66052 type:complete len:283 (+) Transcript_10717:1126-1974(+)